MKYVLDSNVSLKWVLTEADSEFDRCLTRRGEALSLFLDEEPTFAFLPAAAPRGAAVPETVST